VREVADLLGTSRHMLHELMEWCEGFRQVPGSTLVLNRKEGLTRSLPVGISSLFSWCYQNAYCNSHLENNHLVLYILFLNLLTFTKYVLVSDSVFLWYCGFELRASCLLGSYSIMPPASFCF
jgi:hypothetical protein